ncbi:MAG: bifunctional 5,10-methylenetetrahydrofolate dehydrogenase/5,10-methenyltetrahydrofolate cyclohydrolase [Candidatus Saccharimonadales bacterium]
MAATKMSQRSDTIGSEMKLLNGLEMAGFIQERQARAVRGLLQAEGIQPKLAIVATSHHPAIEVYMRMKKRYGADILVEVDIHRVEQPGVTQLIERLNADPSVHGIIVQLPLADPSETDEVCDSVAAAKDVDALGARAIYDPATPMAILWLLAGYNVDLRGKQIVLVGRGKLVGAPLERLLKTGDAFVEVVDRTTADIATVLQKADIIITATGQPGLVTSEMIKPGAVVVDAGVAGEQGKTVGDLASDVYERLDLTITPQKGGVGPLTICALFENVIRAARASVAHD